MFVDLLTILMIGLVVYSTLPVPSVFKSPLADSTVYGFSALSMQIATKQVSEVALVACACSITCEPRPNERAKRQLNFLIIEQYRIKINNQRV